jgi:NADH:ubiquinone oxidoreductase subunit E
MLQEGYRFMSNFYKHHIFFCNNIRTNGKQCCSQNGAKELYRYAKDRCRENLMLGEGRFGVSESRCLGRCEHGPVAVVYPTTFGIRLLMKKTLTRLLIHT